MSSEIPSTQDIQKVAMLFADAFQKKGVGGSAANVSKINTANTGDSSGVNFGGGAKEKIDEHTLIKLKNQLLKKSNQALQDFLDIQQTIKKTGKETEVQNKRLKKIQEELAEGASVLGDSFIDTAKDFKDGKLKAADVKKFIGDDISKISAKVADDIEEAGDDIADSMKEAGSFISSASNKLEEITSNFAIKAAMTATVKNFSQQLTDTMKYGSSILRGINTAGNALRLGISPSDLLELESKNKRLVAGMGGAANFAEQMNTLSDSQFKYYGNLGEAVKGSTQVMTAFSLGGVKVDKAMESFSKQTIGGSSGLTQTFREIQAATGQTFAEQAAAMEEYVKNDNIRNRLIGASNAQERRAVIERGLATKRMLVGLGLTAEQATRAGEALHGVAGMDPKERLQESYKAQAVLGALGIENAELVGKAMRAGGVDNLAPEEQAKAMVAIAEAAQMKAKAQSSQVSGQGLSQFAILGKGGGALDNMMKGLGDLNISDPEAARKEIARNLKELGEDDDSLLAPALRTVSEITQMVTTGMGTNALLGGISVMLMGMTRLMMMKAGSRGAAVGLGEMFSKVRGVARSGAGGIANMARGGAGMASSAAGGIANMARGAAGAAGAAGVASSAAGGGIAKGGSMLSKASGYLGKGLKFAKFLGPIAAIGGAVYGAAEGFMQAGDIFKGRELTTGMKAASAFGGVISSLSFGLIEAGSVAKGVHGLFDSDEKKKKKGTSKSNRFPSMEVDKIYEFGRGTRGMSDHGDFNDAMGQAGGDKKLRQFLIQSRFGGGEASQPTTKRTGGRNSRIQAPMGSAKSLNVSSLAGADAKIMRGNRTNAGVEAQENEVKEALLAQNALLEKIANNSDKGVSVNEKQLKTSNDMKRNQETAAAEASEYGGNGLAFNSAEF